MDNMIGILVMLNNYFHDFFTATFLVCSYAMVLLVKFVMDRGEEPKRLVVDIYPKLLHLNVGSVIFLFMAGIVRAFTYEKYEWANAIGTGQVPALMVKHALLFGLFFYAVFLWIGVHKKIQSLRRELGIIQ